jgi:hypothetical protein
MLNTDALFASSFPFVPGSLRSNDLDFSSGGAWFDVAYRDVTVVFLDYIASETFQTLPQSSLTI